MRLILPIAVALVVFGAAAVKANGGEPGPFLEPVVVADPFGIAFFSVAPERIVSSMRKATSSFCGDYAERMVWLCNGGPLHFMRAVNVKGYKLKSGLVCSGKLGAMFYPSDVLERASECIAIDYDDSTKQHHIEAWKLPPRY